MRVLIRRRITNKRFGIFVVRVTAIEVNPNDKTRIIVTLSVNRLKQKHESSFSLPVRGALCRINGIAIQRGAVYGKTKLAEMILKHLHSEVWTDEDGPGILFTLPQESFPEVDYLCWWARSSQDFMS